jgi:hypothetical protein
VASKPAPAPKAAPVPKTQPSSGAIAIVTPVVQSHEELA